MSSPSNLKLFLRISCELTGFSEAELEETGMLDTYYDTVQASNSASELMYFFQKVNEILSAPGSTGKTIEQAITIHLMPVANYNNLARNIILLWYTGNWGDNVVNADSYVQGLMWNVGHTHPPGAKQPGYGSWAIRPFSVRS
jgi:hypothetical protein